MAKNGKVKIIRQSHPLYDHIAARKRLAMQIPLLAVGQKWVGVALAQGGVVEILKLTSSADVPWPIVKFVTDFGLEETVGGPAFIHAVRKPP